MRALRDKQKFIDECNAEEERLQEEAKLLNKAATIIQLIWRGHMVRHQLGKYKNLQKRSRKRKKLREQ